MERFDRANNLPPAPTPVQAVAQLPTPQTNGHSNAYSSSSSSPKKVKSEPKVSPEASSGSRGIDYEEDSDAASPPKKKRKQNGSSSKESDDAKLAALLQAQENRFVITPTCCLRMSCSLYSIGYLDVRIFVV